MTLPPNAPCKRAGCDEPRKAEVMSYVDDAPAELTPKQLRRRNKQLMKEGLRICRTHQGVALPLTEEYFYRQSKAKGGYFDTECKRCKNQRSQQRVSERRKTDAAYVAQTRIWKRNSHLRHRDEVNRRRRLKRYRQAFGQHVQAESAR